MWSNQKPRKRCPNGCMGGFVNKQVPSGHCVYGRKCPFCDNMRYVWKDVRERCDYYCDCGHAR
ncbi:hypothetical protein ACVWWO_006415 [Bradyrhizobium sp. F1.13.1]